jgi:hypothetical protein
VDAVAGLRISQAASSRVSGDGGGNRRPLLLPGTADSGFLGMAASASTMALLGFPHGREAGKEVKGEGEQGKGERQGDEITYGSGEYIIFSSYLNSAQYVNNKKTII